VPDLPFVDREGYHVDFTGIGELWEPQTDASVRTRGLPDNGGVQYGRVTLKDGSRRNLFEPLVAPRHDSLAAAFAATQALRERGNRRIQLLMLSAMTLPPGRRQEK
jgi:hypothetical protein